VKTIQIESKPTKTKTMGLLGWGNARRVSYPDGELIVKWKPTLGRRLGSVNGAVPISDKQRDAGQPIQG